MSSDTEKRIPFVLKYTYKRVSFTKRTYNNVRLCINVTYFSKHNSLLWFNGMAKVSLKCCLKGIEEQSVEFVDLTETIVEPPEVRVNTDEGSGH